MARPRKPIGAERWARLMDVARKHFACHGFVGSSLAALLAEAGFARSSFYYFFDDKASLFDAAFADGLAQIGDVVNLPQPESLTAESFWPTLRALVEDLQRAGADPGLLATARLFHLTDAPPTERRTTFEAAARDWCRGLVVGGRRLGVLDEDLPEDLHAELTWGVAQMADRWLSAPEVREVGRADVAWTLLKRVLGGNYFVERGDASR